MKVEVKKGVVFLNGKRAELPELFDAKRDDQGRCKARAIFNAPGSEIYFKDGQAVIPDGAYEGRRTSAKFKTLIFNRVQAFR